jgi:hypothetical protein
VQALAGTGRETVVAKVVDGLSHVLQVLLSKPGKGQHDGDREQPSNQTQTLLGAQAGSGGQEVVLVANREGLVSNLNMTMNPLSSKS